MAEDAVAVALAQGVTFGPELDKTGKGYVTALFVVHAGEDAAVQVGVGQRAIWLRGSGTLPRGHRVVAGLATQSQ